MSIDDQTPDQLQYARPDGIDGSFAPDPQPADAAYTPPPPTVSPEQREQFGRPSGAGEFDPPVGERLPPRHGVAAPPIAPGARETFGGSTADGFDPPAGSRIEPSGAPVESPWWKSDARRDPWRDPRSPAWLGRPAVLSAGELAQLDPESDTETTEEAEPEVEDETPASAPVRIGRFGLSALLFAIIIALVAGGIGGGAGYWLANRTHSLTNPDLKIAKTATAANRPPGSVADIAKRVSPAVVSIDVTSPTEQGTGSGVVIDGSNGYILTNNHVVSAVATAGGTVVVTFNDQSTATARIVGRDTLTDLAVIKVDKSGLTQATLGDSSKLAVGDPVVAIGSPLGLRGTVTSGIVSALDRPVHLSGSESDTNAVIDAIQTDAAINPGNSGGALVDAQGAVIGINSAIASLPAASGSENGSIGLGFAIPINGARTIAQELINTGKAVHASIGLSTRAYTDGTRDGAYVVQVTPNGPGAAAGFKPGDIITVADSTLITSGDELTVVVQQHKPGDKIVIRYLRGTAESTVTVTLASA